MPSGGLAAFFLWTLVLVLSKIIPDVLRRDKLQFSQQSRQLSSLSWIEGSMTDATISAAPAQHKQPSRKGKKAWRKNVDVTEINEGLDEVREQVIKHGYVFTW